MGPGEAGAAAAMDGWGLGILGRQRGARAISVSELLTGGLAEKRRAGIEAGRCHVGRLGWRLGAGRGWWNGSRQASDSDSEAS